ncbi:sugar transporter domain-containing protein [Ditylenchus destructor]|nr:sugar transporter domain-containing protein [Ditylenchus destructor]
MVGVAVADLDKDIGIPKPDKKPILGRYVYLLSAMAAIGGFLFGYDTGIVSSAFIYVPRSPELRPVTHVWVEVMVGITAVFAGAGAILTGRLTDRYGRKKMVFCSCISFAIGALALQSVCTTCPSRISSENPSAQACPTKDGPRYGTRLRKTDFAVRFETELCLMNYRVLQTFLYTVIFCGLGQDQSRIFSLISGSIQKIFD